MCTISQIGDGRKAVIPCGRKHVIKINGLTRRIDDVLVTSGHVAVLKPAHPASVHPVVMAEARAVGRRNAMLQSVGRTDLVEAFGTDYIADAMLEAVEVVE